MATFIILLRGVTPTGKNKVLMAPLRAALADAGLNNVQTYIQSGNIITESDLTRSKLEKRVHDVIHRNFGADIAILARTPQQIADILKHHPLQAGDGTKLYFSLLTTRLDEKLLSAFLSIDFSPDKVRYVNNTIYTLYATKHSDSTLNNNDFERKLKVTATTRNLNTMTSLAALASAHQGVPNGDRKRRG